MKSFLPLVIVTLLTGCVSLADNCDHDRYNPPEIVSISRPLSIMIVDEMPDIKGCKGNWACASNAHGQGRAIVYLRRDKQACLYHEIAHVGGWNHE